MEREDPPPPPRDHHHHPFKPLCKNLNSLKLNRYHTTSTFHVLNRLNFYMIGWNGNRVYRVLKIDRFDASEITLRIPLPIPKKNATSCLNGYTKTTRPHAASNWSVSVMASLSQGSLSFGDHTTCGHRVYEVSKSEIISLRNSCVLSNIANSREVQEAPVYGGPYKELLFQLLFQYNA
ncbi:hypothetical protein Rs2_48208 [Raphanus sativus]|nr:hypothetical protein Rs2_48208 [Raphanus sativus]